MSKIGVGQLALTAGKESYTVAGGGSFDVGPITVVLNWDPSDGELTLETVYEAARREVEVLFEAEFAMKQHAYAERRKDLG